jgi:hypothetical protein
LVSVAEAFQHGLALAPPFSISAWARLRSLVLAALLEPGLIKNDLLVGKCEIALGEQDDGVLARLRRMVAAVSNY